MSKYNFQNLFFDHLNELYSAEKQLISIFPQLIYVTSSSKLRHIFNQYLQDIEGHRDDLTQIFEEIKLQPTDTVCQPVEGVIQELQNVIQLGGNSSAKDAALICIVQRLQHFKMAAYGSARTFARHFNYSKPMQLLQHCLNEEGECDHELTKLAEGGFFTTGINEEALQEERYEEQKS